MLTRMLLDICRQLKAIKVTDAQALLIVHTSYGKMVEWEKKLVRFANAADRAKAGIAGMSCVCVCLCLCWCFKSAIEKAKAYIAVGVVNTSGTCIHIPPAPRRA